MLKITNEIKISNNINKTYTISFSTSEITIQNELEEAMIITEKQLFDAVDNFFKRKF